MLKFLIFSLFAISIHTQASDKHTGERVIYRLIYDGRDQAVAIADVLSKTEDRLYQIETQLYIEETQEFLTSYVSEDHISNKKSMTQILNDCRSMGGKIDRVYAAGRLSKSCKLSVNHPIAKERLSLLNIKDKDLSRGFVWLGQVPVYGIIKLNSPELIMDITYFLWMQ